MISESLHALQGGIKVMKSNTRLLMVGVLVFVFPLLFVWITQSFFATAYSNIDTAQKQRISLLHESISGVVEYADNYEEVIPKLIQKYAADNPDISKIRVVKIGRDEVTVLFSLNEDLAGTNERAQELFRTLPNLGAGESIIFPTTINGVRTWQVFRSIERDNRQLVIFSEHTFGMIDSIMTARRQQSYFGLTGIFLFLIALAYWLNRQVYWEKHHHRLEQQLKDRDLFSNMIAHEFRAPLTAIKGYASFLEEAETASKEEKRFATNIRVSAQRLVLLVSDFLEVARLQSGKLKIEKTLVDLREVLSLVTEELQLSAKEKGLMLVYEQPVQPVMMQTDRARMIQVITNMVSNSVKYTPSGAVELECQKEAGKIRIIIKDTGTGISAEDQKKLFAPFTRVGDVDHTSTTGTGLGMWITKQLVDLLDGEIGVESIQGVGTHIVITFKQNL
jgi:signal transduction histidine kinase